MSEMMERVAKAIMSEENPDSTDQYLAMARAAIEAMREPTEVMIIAGDAADYDCTEDIEISRLIGNDGIKIVFNAMVDEALK